MQATGFNKPEDGQPPPYNPGYNPAYNPNYAQGMPTTHSQPNPVIFHHSTNVPIPAQPHLIMNSSNSGPSSGCCCCCCTCPFWVCGLIFGLIALIIVVSVLSSIKEH